ncbi:MAG: host attachment protein [Verrucomicrobiae bacterium]|nr:host attachment protein [Verrucomicrobiae bacterium]
MKTLFIVADLGRVRAFQKKSGDELSGAKDHLTELEDAAFSRRDASLGETVTDQAGRFGQGNMAGQSGGMSFGEEHELEREMERKAISEVARHVDQVINDAGCPTCVLAAPKSILHRLEDALAPGSRDAIAESIPADLTRQSIKELEERFLS